MRKILLLIVLFGVTITGVRAQVGIGTQDPNPAAQLDITSDPTNPGARGLLIPRVTLTGTTMLLTGIAEADMPNSILVFNKDSFVEGGKTYSVGYYYWATNTPNAEKGAGKWVPILSGEAQVVNNFFNTVNTTSSTVNYNSTSNTLSVNVGNGLKNLTNASGKYVGLGGDLDQATTIKTDASKTLAITGLQSGTTTNTLVVTDANGVLRKVKGVSASQIVADASNAGKILSVNSSGLVTWTTIGAGGSSTSSSSSSTVVYNPKSNTLDVKVGNGLEEITGTSGKYIGLGGTLSKSTTITTDGTNTLAIKGLKGGASTDKLVVVDPTTGVLKTVSGVTVSQIAAGGKTGTVLSIDNSGNVTWTTIGAGAPGTSSSSSTIVYNTISNTFDAKVGNGLQEITNASGKYIGLGGALEQATEIMTTSTKTLAIEGLQAGGGTDKLVVAAAGGVLKTVTGVTVSQIDAGTGNGGKVLTVDNTTGNVTWTAIGGTSNPLDLSNVAGNGITYDSASGTLNWGGELTKTATIATENNKGFEIKPKNVGDNSNVVIEKLPEGDSNDSFVVVGADGKLKKVDPKSAAKIDYTDGPQETGRRWKVGAGVDFPVQEVTFEVTFNNSTSVDIASVLKSKNAITDNKQLKVLSIRTIEKTGNTAATNTKATSITQSGVYDPTSGKLMLGMSSSTVFSVKFNGTFYIVVEFIKLP